MLQFYPESDITNLELCEVFQLAGSIAPGVGVRASRLRGKDELVRHFVCTVLSYNAKAASNCVLCAYCPFKDEGEVDE